MPRLPLSLVVVLLALAPLSASADVPQFAAHLQTLVAPDAKAQASVAVSLENLSDTAATDVTIVLTGGQSILSWSPPDWTCKRTNENQLTCTAATIPAHASPSIVLYIRFAAREIRTAVTVAIWPGQPRQESISLPVVFYRDFAVTTTADSGAGSLRQAITDANAQCSATGAPPCRITFGVNEPVPPEGWFTIAPASPLPPITALDFAIDAETETASTGDTNPAGPEVFLDGRNAGLTDGLTITGMTGVSTRGVVRGLAIGGFAFNGILMQPRAVFLSYGVTVERNYIGVDPTGSRAMANGQRGIRVMSAGGQITGNVISGNGRSGAWLERVDGFLVSDNRIGVAAHSDDPLPNGGSGIFFVNTTPFGTLVVQHNVIANNHDDGVASTRNARFELLDNTIVNNGMAVDVGLDGPSAEVDVWIGPAPIVTSARYGAASGTTSIEGHVKPTSYLGHPSALTVYLYANSNAVPQGEQFLGSALADANGNFTLQVKRDLRGRFIDGTTRQRANFGDSFPTSTSEFGVPVAVTE
jgi:hypothetical protein